MSDKVRVGVDGFNLAIPTGTGIATYGRSLCAALDAMGHPIDLIYGVNVGRKSARGMRESLFFSALDQVVVPGTAQRMTLKRRMHRLAMLPGVRDVVEIPREGRVIADGLAERVPPSDRLFTRSGLFETAARYFKRYGKPLRLRVPDPPAIMHWTYPLPVEVVGAVNLYTIHDLIPLRLPHTSLEDKGYFGRVIRTILDRGAGVCTVSETSRQDIVRLFDVAPERILDLSQSADLAAQRVEDDETLGRWLRAVFDLPLRGYFVFVGTIEPKKNVGRLIEAYLQSGVTTPLVIVGRDGWKSDGELRLLRGGAGVTLPGTARIRRIDHAPRDAVLRLIRGAHALCFPSLYEGFGLPVLEAMSLGTPVIASDTPALRELADGAALLVPPYETEALAAALRRLDGNSALRGQLASLGAERASRYSSEIFQQKLADAYGGLIAGNRRS